MNEVAKYQGGAIQTAADVRQHVNLIQEVMQAVMKKDTHYGTIPGCKKPTLYKPGAEVLAATFRIAPSFKVEDLSGNGAIRYRVVCVGTHQTSGTVMGEGAGECSSDEEKYKWRRAICDEEFEDTPENMRRVKYSKYQGKVEKTRQVRAEPADAANTILKMACKRAQVAMTLNVTAASDIFSQDIEDLPEHLRTDDESDSGALPAEQLADFEQKIEAVASKEAAQALWKSIAAACRAAKDLNAYNSLKSKVTAKASKMQDAAA